MTGLNVNLNVNISLPNMGMPSMAMPNLGAGPVNNVGNPSMQPTATAAQPQYGQGMADFFQANPTLLQNQGGQNNPLQGLNGNTGCNSCMAGAGQPDFSLNQPGANDGLGMSLLGGMPQQNALSQWPLPQSLNANPTPVGQTSAQGVQPDISQLLSFIPQIPTPQFAPQSTGLSIPNIGMNTSGGLGNLPVGSIGLSPDTLGFMNGIWSMVGRTMGGVQGGVQGSPAGMANASNQSSRSARDGQNVGAGPKVNPKDTAAAVKFFENKGWTHAQAVGIVANLKAESGLNPTSVGDHGSAYGIGQWHPDRQNEFKKWTGKDIRNATLNEQLAFVDYELRQGNEQNAGRKLQQATTATQAAAIITRFYERPGNIDQRVQERSAIASAMA